MSQSANDRSTPAPNIGPLVEDQQSLEVIRDGKPVVKKVLNRESGLDEGESRVHDVQGQ